MTNAEAIQALVALLPVEGYFTTATITRDSIEHRALKYALDALREKADKERRYVVNQLMTCCEVYDRTLREPVANNIPTESQAQSIADIYEGVKQ